MIIKDIKDAVYYDTETTGLDPVENRILEHGCIRVRDGKIVEELRIIVNQKVPIQAFLTEIHGITEEMCTKEGKDPKESAQKILNFMGDDVVIGLNNVCFDHCFLECETNRYGLSRPKIESWFDIGLWYKGLVIGNLYNEKELFYLYCRRIKDIRAKGVKYNLNYLVKTFGVENLREGGVHGAIRDLRMTKHVFDKMKEKYCA